MDIIDVWTTHNSNQMWLIRDTDGRTRIYLHGPPDRSGDGTHIATVTHSHGYIQRMTYRDLYVDQTAEWDSWLRERTTAALVSRIAE